MNDETVIEDIIRYKEIKKGWTNISYYLKTKENEYFYQIYLNDKHNHKINISILNDFKFVPKIFYSSKNELISQYIKNEKFEINSDSLLAMANILKTLHTSNKKFPKNNIAKRIKHYFSLVKNKNDIPEEIYEYVKPVIKLTKGLLKDIPSHNDASIGNFIMNKNIYYLCDWEYATMNNKHFDLAYIITGSYFNKYEEEEFLKYYGDYDQYELKKCKIIVIYITLLWVFKQDEIPFPYKPLLKVLNNLFKEIN